MPDCRVMFVQYAGDYRDAYARLQKGEPETYRSQRYTVEAVEEVGRRFGAVASFVLFTDEKYEEMLPSGVKAFGMGLRSHPRHFGDIFRAIESWGPTHLVQRFISSPMLGWAAGRPMRTLAVLAETSPLSGIRNWFRNRRLARILNRPGIEWVGNHHLSATSWLRQIGVHPDKLIPYDYEYAVEPDSFAPKSLAEAGPWTLAYVGAVGAGKGVGDLIEALALLRDAGLPVALRVAGMGEVDLFRRQAKSRGVDGAVEFVGTVANDRVIDLMRSADIVIVPSRHEYTESFGFVVQEAFVSRTPLIASDHRAFRGRVVEGETGLIFPAGNSAALADRIKQLLGAPELYARLSANSAAAWSKMQIPVKWADLILRWLEDSEQSRQWLWEHRLASGLYLSPA